MNKVCHFYVLHCRKFAENIRPVLVENSYSTQSSKRRRLDFWGTEAEQCETQTVNNYSTELDSYLNENCLKTDKDVIMWWEENKNKFLY